MKITVLSGGFSPERTVSLRSAAAVEAALIEAGYDTELVDVKTRDDLDRIDPNTIVFPILHGEYGEDGGVQTDLEETGVKYLGSDSRCSVVAFDKWLTKQALEQSGLPVSLGEKVTAESYRSSQYVNQPHVLKVVAGGSSIGTYIVRNPTEIDQAKVDEVFALDDTALIEPLVVGVEVTVPILGSTALPVIEIRPPEGEEFDYENKYNGESKELCPAQSIDDEGQRQLQALAEKAHVVLGCKHLSRVDMMIGDNGPVILEVNTMPGMTAQSLYPLSAKVAGYTFPELMTKFVQLVESE